MRFAFVFLGVDVTWPRLIAVACLGLVYIGARDARD